MVLEYEGNKKELTNSQAHESLCLSNLLSLVSHLKQQLRALLGNVAEKSLSYSHVKSLITHILKVSSHPQIAPTPALV